MDFWNLSWKDLIHIIKRILGLTKAKAKVKDEDGVTKKDIDYYENEVHKGEYYDYKEEKWLPNKKENPKSRNDMFSDVTSNPRDWYGYTGGGMSSSNVNLGRSIKH